MTMGIVPLASASILVPFAAAPVIAVCKRPAAKWISIAAAAVSLVCALGAWAQFAATGRESVSVVLAAFGQAEVLGFVFDRMSVLLAPCFVGIGLLIDVYSVGYMSAGNREHPDAPRRRFYAFFTVFIGAMAGLVYSSTVVGQLVFFEITGACSWALIGYYDTPTARKSAMKALILTHIAALGLYVGAGALFLQTGTFATTAIAGLGESAKTFVLICILIAAWGKSAQLPFYMWLPSAMEAPTPVSAYLHGASMVKVGVAVFARALASAGVVPGAVGWVVMHMFNHAFAKTLFFLVAGAFSFTLGTRMLPKIEGVLKKQPLLGVGFAFAALAIAGVPPMNGFFGKFAIFSGGFAAAEGSWLLMAVVVVGLVETVCCFAWFLKWIGSVLPGEPSPEVADAAPLPAPMAVVIAILIGMTVCSSFIAAAWLG